LDKRLTTLICKNICPDIQRSENRCSLAESSKEGYGPKRAVLLLLLMMMMMTTTTMIIQLTSM
jgi:hypothetical protein